MKAFYIILCCINLVNCLSFTRKTYNVRISNTTLPGTKLSQIVAVPSDPGSATSDITYSVEINTYIAVNKITGDVTLIAQQDFTNFNLRVTAYDNITLKNATAKLAFANANKKCSCFTSSNSLEIDMLENYAPPYGLMYLGTACGKSYTLSNNDMSLFTLNDSRLIVKALDYESSKRVSTTVLCDRKQRNITINIVNVDDNVPYFHGFTQFKITEITVDPEQISSDLGTKIKSLVFLDDDGILEDLELRKENDPNNQLTVSPLRHMGKNFFGTTVYWSNYLVINQSTSVDIVVEDQGFTSRTTDSVNHPNATWRFQLNYVQIDELGILDLQPEYHINVTRDCVQYTQVYRVDHNVSTALRFSLKQQPNSVCEQFVNTTVHEGILFVSNPTALSQCKLDRVQYLLIVSQGNKQRTANFTVQLTGEAEVTHRQTTGSCSEHKDEVNCTNSTGYGAISCMWKLIHARNSNYSTCVPNNLCADAQCNELELSFPELCPQDCLDAEKWIGHSRTCGRRGICKAYGICFCDNAICECLTEDEINQMVYGDDDGGDDDYYSASGEEETSAHFHPSVVSKESKVCGQECMVTVCVLVSFILLLITFVSVYCYYRKRRRPTNKGADASAWRVSGSSLSISLTSSPDYESSTPTTTVSLLSELAAYHPYNNVGNLELFDAKWELARENILIESYVGEGEFGKVMKARVKSTDDSEWITAAVKMLKDGATRTEYMDLISEYNLLKEVDHPNVIKIIGAATSNGPLQLVVEYCEHGSLKNYLRGIRNEEPVYINGCTDFFSHYSSELLSFAWQISKGMQYLSSIKLVHRDLAARNILIATGKVVKISDFGMTKDIYEEEAYKKKGQGRIPVKWMAPESLYHQVYTTKSDVWSFGIVLWEIATLGATPYPGIPPERMYHLLQDGYRMDMPETCSAELYSIMKQCWLYESAHRPTFRDLRYSLERLMEDKANYLDLTVARTHKMCTSDEDVECGTEKQQLTVALLPQNDRKFVEDYLVARSNRAPMYHQQSQLRYLSVDIDDEF